MRAHSGTLQRPPRFPAGLAKAAWGSWGSPASGWGTIVSESGPWCVTRAPRGVLALSCERLAAAILNASLTGFREESTVSFPPFLMRGIFSEARALGCPRQVHRRCDPGIPQCSRF